MLIKMLLGKRKTEDEFKKYITRVACSLFCLGVLGLFVVRSNSLSDYALGLVFGTYPWGLCLVNLLFCDTYPSQTSSSDVYCSLR